MRQGWKWAWIDWNFTYVISSFQLWEIKSQVHWYFLFLHVFPFWLSPGDVSGVTGGGGGGLNDIIFYGTHEKCPVQTHENLLATFINHHLLIFLQIKTLLEQQLSLPLNKPNFWWQSSLTMSSLDATKKSRAFFFLGSNSPNLASVLVKMACASEYSSVSHV